jgi:CRP-like cAMP-binding protein
MQISGDAMRIKADVLHALLPKLPTLERLLSRFAYLQALRMEQLAACNIFHDVDQRLARWLLMVADRVSVETFALTQHQLASMLGLRRASVTVAASKLQNMSHLRTSQFTTVPASDRFLMAFALK